MAESDIQVLLAFLKDLKEDVRKLSDKIDSVIVRLTQAENDIQDLYRANSEVRLTQKRCQEDENAKIDAIVEITKIDDKDKNNNKSNIWTNIVNYWNGLHILIRIIPTIVALLIIIWSSCSHFFIDVKNDFKQDVKPVQTATALLSHKK